MKKLLLLISVILIGATGNAWAQDEETEIAFLASPEFNSVLKTAKKEGKYIFIDCYTTWCNPCKMLDRNVFSKAEVADFFNDAFINVKYDMESGEGIEIKERYNITAYPTLLWIDSKGNLVHKLIGAGNAQYILEQGEIAADPENNLAGLAKRYESGERSSEMLNRYINALKISGQTEKQNDVTVDFVQNMTIEELMDEKNFKLLEENVSDPLAPPMQIIYKNRATFTNKFGKERVSKQCEKCMEGGIAPYIAPHRPEGWGFDLNRWESLVAFYSSVEDEPIASSALANLYMARYAEEGDYDELISTMYDCERYNLIQGMLRCFINMLYMKKIENSGDKEAIEECIEYADYILQGWDNAQTLPNIYESKARLQVALGDEKGAAATREMEKAAHDAYMLKTGGRGMIIGNI